MSEKNIDGNPKQSTVYSWATGSVTAAGTTAGTDLTSVSGFTTLLSNFSNSTSVPGVTLKRVPTKIKVWSTGAAYIKINGGDVISVTSTSPFEAEDLVITSIGVSTGGIAVTLTVYLQ